MKIGFVGLSHLGLISSIVVASKGFDVVCYDEEAIKIHSFKKGEFSIDEPYLKKFYKLYKKKIIYTFNKLDLNSCEVVYFSQDIKTNANNKSDIINYNKLINRTLLFLKKNTIVIIHSQVPPGFTDKILWNKNKLFYQVETLVFGDAIKRASNPERFIIGSHNEKRIPNKLKFFLNEYKCPIIIMNYKSAEFTKISVNLFLISQVSLTNILSQYVKKINGNWENVAKSIKLDKRIGKYSYLKPGLGISGGNLERDLETVRKIFLDEKLSISLFKEYQNISSKFNNWPFEIFKKIRINIPNKNIKIGILGLTYKKNTNSIKNSPAIKFIKQFNDMQLILAYDSNIENIENIEKIKNLKIINSKKEVITKSNIILIFNDSEEFSNIKASLITNRKSLNAIIDPLGMLKKINFKNSNIIYKTLG